MRRLHCVVRVSPARLLSRDFRGVARPGRVSTGRSSAGSTPPALPKASACRPNWSVASGTNIAWKADVPGLGLSSPVVWGNDVFVSTSISGQKDAGLKVGSLRRRATGAR